MSAKKRQAHAEAKKAAAAAPNTAVPAARAPGAAAGGQLAARWLWIAAICLVIAGYALLGKVDPGGRNVWAAVAPALLLAGYLLFIPAIIKTYRG